MQPKPHWEYLGPGCYADETGALHIYIETILRAGVYPNTPESHRLVMDALREAVREHYGEQAAMQITEVEDA